MDHAALFAALPTPYLVLTPDLVVVGANPAYLEVVGRTLDDIVDRPVFEAFPPPPDALDPSGVPRVQLSFERARETGRLDRMPLQKYDIVDPATGELAERYWSLISVPVLDERGQVVLLMQRTEDVTDYVQERGRSDRERGRWWRRRAEEVEADLFARSQELTAAIAAEELSARRLAGLAEVALQLTGAETVEDLTSVVIERGLAALGADGGAVAVLTGTDELHLTLTDSLGDEAKAAFSVLPVDHPLPAAVVARTGERVLLPHRDAALAYAPEMRQVLDETGCSAWACLPLEGSGGRRLGALAVGWRTDPKEFPAAELEVLEALAAQCAQGLERIQVRQAEQASAAAVRRMSETLQRSLLTEPPQPDHLEIAVRYRPAAQEAQVGGDWYDAFLASDGQTCLAIGDVAGHDRDAAAAMGQLRNLLRGVAYTLAEPPAAVLSALDRAIRDLAVGSLATAVLARIEDAPGEDRRLRWSNAGHPPPLLVQPDGVVRLLRGEEADLLLGLDPDTDRADHVVALPPGSTVLLYTDGLIERRDASLDDGLAALVAAAEGLAGLALEELCDRLLEHAGSRDDDVALLALRTHPEAAPRPPEAGPEVLPRDQRREREQATG